MAFGADLILDDALTVVLDYQHDGGVAVFEEDVQAGAFRMEAGVGDRFATDLTQFLVRQDLTYWDNYERARTQLAPYLSLRLPADRYRVRSGDAPGARC